MLNKKILEEVTNKVMAGLSTKDRKELVKRADKKFQELKLKAKSGCEKSYNELVKQIELGTKKRVDHAKLKKHLEELQPE